MNNEKQKKRFSVAITTPTYQNTIKNALQDPNRVRRFISSITSAVSVNPSLQDCEAETILAGALLGESLNLSPSPQLGQYYLVPFNAKSKNENGESVIIKKAQFILGYKGYIQLAIRSGQYKKINVIELKEGELESFDPLNEEIKCCLIKDYDIRESVDTEGYYAMFEYINGFVKAMYWSKEKMEKYADKNSPAFSLSIYKKIQAGEIPEKEMWKYSSYWYKNFDDMAKKTMLRQLISKWGVMSIELQNAIENDNELLEDIDFNQDINKTESFIEHKNETINNKSAEETEKISFEDLK